MGSDRSCGSRLLRAGLSSVLAALVTASAAVSPAAAAPGDVDTSFSGDGKVTIPLQYGVLSQFVDSSGRIWAAGPAAGKGSMGGIGVARLRTDGSLDTSFSGDGSAVYDLSRSPDEYVFPDALRIAPRPGGRAVVAVAVTRLKLDEGDEGEVGYGVSLVGINPSGSIDRTFGDSGIVFVEEPYPAYTSIVAFGTTGDGSIRLATLAVRENTDSAVTVIRHLRPNGTPDRSFSGDGRATAPAVRALDGAFTDDGRVVVTFVSGGVDTNTLAVGRFRAGGGWDKTFSGDGRVLVEKHYLSGNLMSPFGMLFGIFGGYADVAIDGTGRPVVAFKGGTGVAGVVRYRVDGTRDTTFSGDGRAPVDGGRAEGIVVCTDAFDRPVVATWEWRLEGGGGDWVVRRFTNTGAADASFSGDGRASVPGGVYGHISTLSARSGRILLGGAAAPPDGGMSDTKATLVRFSG